MVESKGPPASQKPDDVSKVRREQALSLASEMVECYRDLKRSQYAAMHPDETGLRLDVIVPDELYIQASLAGVGIMNKDLRMEEQNNKAENADKAALAAGKYRICPKCKGEVPERVSARTGSTFYRCNVCGIFVDDTPETRPPVAPKPAPAPKVAPQDSGSPYTEEDPDPVDPITGTPTFQPANELRKCPKCGEFAVRKTSRKTGKDYYWCVPCKGFVNADGTFKGA